MQHRKPPRRYLSPLEQQRHVTFLVLEPQLLVWVLRSQRNLVQRPRGFVAAAAALHNQIGDVKCGSRGVEDQVQSGQRHANDGDDSNDDESDREKEATFTAAAAAAASARFLRGGWVPELFHEQRVLTRRHAVHLVLRELHDIRLVHLAPRRPLQRCDDGGFWVVDLPLHSHESSSARKDPPCARSVRYATWRS
ncbi:unnamed protein product [Sphenostylis stenocarpa]|uniref:Uncharacterized protein n=1 Tax=Sphenostylis stenocarpa TaxID=92480 RepID=A0AA86VX96_9FABA|nr:unnamed protein product [Sphenostylis stenocarpa]